MSRFWEIGEYESHGSKSGPLGFEPWLSQTNYFKIDTCRSLACHLALLGYGKDWFAQCQDNATEWDNRSWYQSLCVSMRQHYKVTMSVHCYIPPLGLSNNCEAQLHI